MFVTIEGGEGSGKDTVVARVASLINAIVTEEPTPWLRNILTTRDQTTPHTAITSEAELFLFLADRSMHYATVIEPALKAKRHVICIRYHHSTLAYQGAGRGLEDTEFLEKACEKTAPFPDLTLYLDCPPEVGLRRKAAQKELDTFESQPLDFHRRVRKMYLDFVSPSFLVVDASQPLEKVVTEVINILSTHVLGLPHGIPLTLSLLTSMGINASGSDSKTSIH